MITLDVNEMPPGISPREVRVFYNGRDVTYQCFRAIVPDEPGKVGRGVVSLYRLTRNGNKFAINPPKKSKRRERVAAQVVKVGLVRWERKVT